MFYIIVILAVIFTMPAKAQSVDPLVGTWKLNVEKSVTVGGPSPEARLMLSLGTEKILSLPLMV
jgi:hypothetical protein